LLATFIRKSDTEVPIDMAQIKIVIEISAAIRAYSIAVAPERTPRNDLRQLVTRCNIAILEACNVSLLLAANALGRFAVNIAGTQSMPNLIAQLQLPVLRKNDEFSRNFCGCSAGKRSISSGVASV
jgi:hypothetical protein